MRLNDWGAPRCKWHITTTPKMTAKTQTRLPRSQRRGMPRCSRTLSSGSYRSGTGCARPPNSGFRSCSCCARKAPRSSGEEELFIIRKKKRKSAATQPPRATPPPPPPPPPLHHHHHHHHHNHCRRRYTASGGSPGLTFGQARTCSHRHRQRHRHPPSESPSSPTKIVLVVVAITPYPPNGKAPRLLQVNPTSRGTSLSAL